MSARALLLGAALAGLVPAGARAGTVAEVSVGGSGEVHVPPTRASFAVSVTTTAPTAAAAGADNARVTKDVTAALYAAGLAKDELRTTRLTVSVSWDFQKGGERVRRGYVATNALQIETHKVDQVGHYLDAALEGGATGVSSPAFASDNRAAARREALAHAVAAARDDAETIARAAGGTLGELLSLATEGGFYESGPTPPAPMAMVRSASAAPTEVVSGDITVGAHVTARWAFVPTPK